MFQDSAAAPREPSAAVPRSPLHATPAFSDGDISIAPEGKPVQKSAAEILAGAEDAVARSAPLAGAAAVSHDVFKTLDEKAAASVSAPAFESAHGGSFGQADTSGSAAPSPFAAPSFEKVASDFSTRVDTPAEPPRFDLDFQLDDADRPAPVKPEPEKATVAAASFGHPAGGLELDKLDLSFNPDRPAFDDPTPSVLDGQWHDAATKLDLAKAYQEMGDTDGAREILQEVLHEGDEQQKSEAQGLLAKLAS
jgi:pilus assembly protein FimV